MVTIYVLLVWTAHWAAPSHWDDSGRHFTAEAYCQVEGEKISKQGNYRCVPAQFAKPPH